MLNTGTYACQRLGRQSSAGTLNGELLEAIIELAGWVRGFSNRSADATYVSCMLPYAAVCCRMLLYDDVC